jgi:nicotinate-nucleotide adenylyltransferase
LSEARRPRPESVAPVDLRLPPVVPGRRIGLFGGSFDPAHAGHIEVSRVALRALALDEIWWLVSPHNPLKAHTPSSDIHRRIRAARALAAADRRIRVTGIEALLGTTYTAETLERLMPRLRGIHGVWMMGADNLAQFHHWRDWRTIAGRIPIAVFNRPGAALRALSSPAARALWRFRMDPSDAAGLAGSRPPAWVFLPSPHVSLSSTEIRAGRAATP